MNDNDEPVPLEVSVEILGHEVIFIQRHIALILATLISNLEKEGSLSPESIESMEANIRHHSARLRGILDEGPQPVLFFQTGVFCIELFDKTFFGVLEEMRAQKRR